MIYPRLYRYNIPKKWGFITATIILATAFLFKSLNYKTTNTLGIHDNPESIFVAKVIDGDTIVLNNGKAVRYIGIDTPELHHPKKAVECFAKEAMEKNKELVLGRKVLLKKDISETDRYGRLLRYVYIEDSSEETIDSVNEQLVKEGYARAVTFPPDVSKAEKLNNLEKEAREFSLGLWAKCDF